MPLIETCPLAAVDDGRKTQDDCRIRQAINETRHYSARSA